mmetsp:Transcript_11511/g.13225  ORF Transcript_11511/g.13225 Transcript_11511/m.13225 type:complete len:222 (-) Transcript_11511:88-753(-)
MGHGDRHHHQQQQERAAAMRRLPRGSAVAEDKEGHHVAPKSMFRSERQANFRKNIRKEVMSSGKQVKDEERRRMEEYRRLCKKEGIVSSRLQEYDAMREEADKNLDERLRAIETDTSLTNAEKRKRKFSLKQKQASTSVTELATSARRTNYAMRSVEKLQAEREAEREAETQRRAQNVRDKIQKMKTRKEVQQFHTMKTRKGQPVMAGKLSALMTKIERSR